MNDAALAARLETFGWLPVGSSRSSTDPKAIEDAAQAYAAFYGIHGPIELRAHLANRFCNVPDPAPVAPYGAEANRQDCRWRHSPVRVHASFRIGPFDEARVREAFVWSMNRWSSVCGLRWQYVERDGRPNILPHAQRIDGNAGTLAWSFLPCPPVDDSSVMQQRYDTADPILVRSYEFFRAVVLHELGHALGLEHTNDREAIMFPSARDEVLDIGGDDIPRIRRLYPGQGANPSPTPPPPDSPPPSPGVDLAPFAGRYIGRRASDNRGVRLVIEAPSTIRFEAI